MQRTRSVRSVLSCAQATACSQCRSRATCTLQPAAANDTHAATWRLANSSRGGGSSSSSGTSEPGTAERLLNLDMRPPLPEKSVFRRVLPDQLVAFSSEKGRKYFGEAMASGHLEPYFPLSEQFHTQEEPTFCGLGTLTMVMNALKVDPRRRWRDETGPGWRWWSDAMFPTGCSSSLEEMRANGTTMDDFGLLAAANGADVRMRRATDEGESLDTFRHSIVASATRSDSFVVTSFCRASLGQTGAHMTRHDANTRWGREAGDALRDRAFPALTRRSCSGRLPSSLSHPAHTFCSPPAPVSASSSPLPTLTRRRRAFFAHRRLPRLHRLRPHPRRRPVQVSAVLGTAQPAVEGIA